MMKCKIVHNEGIIWILLLVIIVRISCSYLSSDSQSIQELCSSNRYIYTIKAEEPQQLKLVYNSSVEINKWYQKSKRKCRKEFKTNNGASHFVIVISNMTIPSCSEKCHCNYFEITEPGNTEKFCGEHKEAIYFESKSDYLSIDFLHGLSMGFEVTLDFTVVRNTYIVTGLPNDPYLSGHFIETPYFPNTYQSDYTSEYIFHSDGVDGHVLLLFLDFQIAPASYVEVVGHNGTTPGRFYGDTFRPPVFLSQQNTLTLKFEANRQPGSSGFRAVSYFIRNSDLPAAKPFINCGGSKYGYGGSIVLEQQQTGFYDCLWHITTPFFSQSPYFLTVANISLVNVGPKTSLEFREGQNSKSKLVKNLECSNPNCSSVPFEITVSAYKGLYVRLSGDLNPSSAILMIYGTYHTGNCSTEQSNCDGRCFPPDLVCDGLQHCPDGSDELECTKTTVETPVVEKKHFASIKAGAAFNVILSFGVCGLAFVVVALVIIFYKGFKTNIPSEETGHPELISEMSGPLPNYSSNSNLDHLPSYEDFIQASERYPPLLFTRAAKRYSEPQIAYRNKLHTTSFCDKIMVEPPPVRSHIAVNLQSVPMENMFAEEVPIPSEPSCSYESRDLHHCSTDSKFKPTLVGSGIKRAWSSDSKLDELSSRDCHLHLSITHCIFPRNCDQCLKTQYYSLPINFKIDSCDKSNGIDIILPQHAAPKINVSKNRHLSFCCEASGRRPKILKIKTRCHSDPCQFSIHYSLH